MSPAPGQLPDLTRDSHSLGLFLIIPARGQYRAPRTSVTTFLVSNVRNNSLKRHHLSHSRRHYLSLSSLPLTSLTMIIPGVSLLSSSADALSRHSYHDGEDAAFFDAIDAENATHIERSRDLQHHLNYEAERHRKQILAIRTTFSGPPYTETPPLTPRAKRDIKTRVRLWGKQQAHKMRRTTQG